MKGTWRMKYLQVFGGRHIEDEIFSILVKRYVENEDFAGF